MAHYANQKTIYLGNAKDIQHTPGTNEGYVYALKNGPRRIAMKLLSGNAYKLYEDLLMWDNAKKIDFSPARIAKETGMSDEGARRALKELIDKGFIVINERGQYEFFPISRYNTVDE